MSLYDDMKAEYATPADALNAMRGALHERDRESADNETLADALHVALDERDEALRRVASMHDALRKEANRSEQAFRDRDRYRAVCERACESWDDPPPGVRQDVRYQAVVRDAREALKPEGTSEGVSAGIPGARP